MSNHESVKKAISLFETQIDLIKHNGLKNGRSGAAIIYFIIYRITEQIEYEEKGYELLDFIASNVSEVRSLDFEEGISGIGWTIEWLNQNKFISCETDDILGDMDNAMYNLLKHSQLKSNDLKNGALCFANYFLIRFKSAFKHSPKIKNIYLGACLAVASKDLKANIFDNPNSFLKIDTYTNEELNNTAEILFFLSEMTNLRHSTNEVESIYYLILEKVEEIIKAVSKNEAELAKVMISLQHVMLALYVCSNAFNFKIWKRKAENTLFDLMLIVDKNKRYSNDQNTLYSLTFASIANISLKNLCEKNFVSGNDQNIDSTILQILATNYPDIINWSEVLRIWNDEDFKDRNNVS